MKKVQVLGPGCPKCKLQAENVAQAAKELGIEIELVKVTSINDISSFGVMLTPAIAVDGVVKASGKVVATRDIKSWLQ